MPSGPELDLYDCLVDEAGRSWIVLGDVVGRGHAGAITQAMIKAVFGSLAEGTRTPADVLDGMDRVLRTIEDQHALAECALARLDPRTGECLVSMAGHPPLLCFDGNKSIEVNTQELPLGKGPPRRYQDLAVPLPRGGVLVVASGGLFDAGSPDGEPYGSERPRALLEALHVGAVPVRRDASAIVEALIADWDVHRQDVLPPDDTTILVIRRLPGP